MSQLNNLSRKSDSAKFISSIIGLLQDDPVLGYKKLASLDFKLPPIFRRKEFWKKYDYIEVKDSIVKRKLDILKIFFENHNYFYHIYNQEYQKFKYLNITERIKYLFKIFSLELSNNPNPKLSRIDRLFFLSEAINKSLSLTYEETSREISLDLKFAYYFYNSKLFEEIADAFVFWSFDLYEGEGNEYTLRPKNERAWGLRIEEFLKTELLLSAYGNKHIDDVSNLQPFKDNDPIYETQKGLCTLLVENGTIVSSHEGTFGKTVDGIYDIKHFDFLHKQWFLKFYRDELESCFEPKYATLLENTKIRLKKDCIRLYDLFSLLAGIKSLLSISMPYNQSNEGDVVVFGITELLDRFHSFDFPITFTSEYIKVLLEFAIHRHKFPGIFINDSKIFISTSVFSYFPILNTIFQRCFSDIFYKEVTEIKNDEGILKKETENSIREKDVVKGLKEMFNSPSFKILTNIELERIGFEIDGEIDLIVADNYEKIMIVCEVKLDNTANDRWINKARWLTEHIAKAKEQHFKDHRFINSSVGNNYLIENGINYDDSWNTFHFLVSDNMFCDHELYWFNKESKKYFRKISIFELECLLGGLDIFKEGTRKWVLYHTNLIIKYRPEIFIPQELKNFIDNDKDFSNAMKFRDFILENKVIANKQDSLTQLIKLIDEGILWDAPEKWFDDINYKLTTEYCEPKYSLIV